MSATGPADKAAVRVLNRNSCGSGSVCGLSENGSYVLTNAHVAGTDLGRVVKVNTQSHGELSAKVIMAGYSDRIQMDWAILHIDNFQEIEPVKLSMEKPKVGNSYYTKGSPRCVWPLVSTNITPVDMSPNSALWRWRPNAIGGQSGSGVWSDDNHYCYGLLTWSWGGLGAGQQTAMIYEQYRQAMTGKPVLGIPRWEGLIELPGDEEYDNGPEYTNPSVSEGVFLQTNVSELPIWVNPSAPDPEPEPEPGPDPEPNPDPNPGEPSGWKRWTENHLKKQIALLASELKSLGAETDPEPEPEPNPTPEPDDDGCIFGMPPLE